MHAANEHIGKVGDSDYTHVHCAARIDRGIYLATQTPWGTRHVPLYDGRGFINVQIYAPGQVYVLQAISATGSRAGV